MEQKPTTQEIQDQKDLIAYLGVTTYIKTVKWTCAH